MSSKLDFLRPQYWIAFLLAVGASVLLLKPGHPGPLYQHSLRNYAIIYVLFGGFLGIPRLFWTQRTAFWQTLVVGLISFSLIIWMEIQNLLNARPELTLSETSWILTDPRILIPYIVVLMAVLGITKSIRVQVLTGLLIVIPFVYVISTYNPGVDGFGVGFAFFSTIVIILLGGVIGLPIYGLTRSLRTNSEPIGREYLSQVDRL